MKSQWLLVVAALVVVGCGDDADTALDGGTDSGAVDGGADAAAAPDAAEPRDAGRDAGAGRVIFDIRLTLVGGTDPVGPGVRACEVSAVPENCVSGDATGAVSISLPDDADVVLSYEAPGLRTFHHAVHTGSPEVARPRYNMYTMAEEVAAYAPIGGISPTTGEAVLAVERGIGRGGLPGVGANVVSPAGVRFYGVGSDGFHSLTEPLTDENGALAAAGVPTGEIVFTATSPGGAPCAPWFGGFEAGTLDGGATAYRIPVTAGVDTRMDLRCP